MWKTKQVFGFLAILIISVYFVRCNQSGNNRNNNRVDLKIVRFDKELFSLDIYSPADSVKELARKYSEFMPLFSNRIIEIGDTSEPWFADALMRFVTDQAIFNIYKKVSEVYPDFVKQQSELEAGFSEFTALFPEKEIPTIYTYISGLNQSMVTADGILGISLEKYLGTSNSLYDEVYPPIPQYLRSRMNPENIPTDALKAWCSSEFEYNPEQKNLLSKMLYEGRNIFLLKQLFPEKPDTLIWNFSADQMQFCLDNEKQMWTYLIEQKLLFITDNFRINQFVEEAPFTKDFSTDSPGKSAIWIGYRIVEKYFDRNKLTIQQLMQENNFQKILNESRYSP